MCYVWHTTPTQDGGTPLDNAGITNRANTRRARVAHHQDAPSAPWGQGNRLRSASGFAAGRRPALVRLGEEATAAGQISVPTPGSTAQRHPWLDHGGRETPRMHVSSASYLPQRRIGLRATSDAAATVRPSSPPSATIP